jgi:hypothetical protein
MKYSSTVNNQTGVVVILQTCIQELLNKILARLPAILTEVVHGFSHPVQLNARIVP